MGVEIRWFFERLLPGEVSTWFERDLLGESPPLREERTDIYLAAREDLGIKLREGKLEIKWRPNPGLVFSASGRPRGQGEYWDKWSWNDPESKADVQITKLLKERSDHPWIPVEKERHQHKYELAAGALRNVGPGQKVDQGVIIELTTLKVYGRSWWTLGLDLLGKAQDPDESLKEAKEVFEKSLGRLFEKYPGPALKLDNSYGYPKFVLAIKE